MIAILQNMMDERDRITNEEMAAEMYLAFSLKVETPMSKMILDAAFWNESALLTTVIMR